VGFHKPKVMQVQRFRHLGDGWGRSAVVRPWGGRSADVMSGGGLLQRALQAVQAPINALTGSTATAIRNALPFGGDATFAPGFAGEKHAIIKLSNGNNGTANFLGPGTQVIKRLKRKDRGRTPVDSIARAHDLRYTLAQNVQDIRAADRRMLKKLKTVKDAPRNVMIGKRVIQAKILAEKAGLLKRDAFMGKKRLPEGADRRLVRGALTKMEQSGFGTLYIPRGTLGTLIRVNMKGSGAKSLQALARSVIWKLLKGRYKRHHKRLAGLMTRGMAGSGKAWGNFKRVFKKIYPIISTIAKPLLASAGPKGVLAAGVLQGVDALM
jgi:hypothetical protein